MTTGAFCVFRAGPSHVERWALMRAALWPETALADHRDEILGLLGQPDGKAAAFLVSDDQDDAVGFAEATLRHDHVNGCETTPVAFLEGIFVEPIARRTGAARALTEAVLAWGRNHGCKELASDADIFNYASHDFHAALGFTETERVVYFRRPID
ncbi:MAG: hypothetical protein COC10_03700 [Sphingobium sp.]|jgi:aminoglycoside 6'-N-acetyltransferase I|nr:MAG: hypothetical protein COC10_03700 [Sphingobium sp.]